MLKIPSKFLLGSMLLLGSSIAFAASTADLRVTGKVMPGACEPSFVGGGVDYGNISLSDLDRVNPTTLADKTIAYGIVCNGPIAVATSWVDGRDGTALHLVGGSFAREFGLGLQGSAKIGSFIVRQVTSSLTADGEVVNLISSNNGGINWRESTGDVHHDDELQSYALEGTQVPRAYKNYSGSMVVTTTIAPTSTLDTSADVTLDGLATMEVRYL